MLPRLRSGSPMRRLALLGLLTISLTGCAGASPFNACRTIPLPEYGLEKSAVIAGQIRAAPAELQGFALDAVALRDAVKACRG